MARWGDGVFTREELDVLDAYRRPRSQEWRIGAPALLVVDVVESFVGPDVPVRQAQEVSPTACGERAWRAIERIGPLLAAFRQAGAPVAFSAIQGLPPAGAAGPARPRSALRSDRVVEPLAPSAGEYVFLKTRPSAFFGTPLLSWLTARRVDQVVVVGGATSGCIRATALDAFSSSLDVLLPHDACFDRVETSHVVTLTDLDTKYARVVSTADVVERLVERAAAPA